MCQIILKLFKQQLERYFKNQRICENVARNVHAYYLYRIMLKLIFWCFVIYSIYRLVFDLIVPVSRTVSKMKQTVQQMQEQQGFQQQQHTTTAQKPQTTDTKTSTSTNDEYIEFEELK